MRLVTFELATPLGPVRRLGLWRRPSILDVNRAYTTWLARSEDRVFAEQYAAAVLPPDMLGFFRAGERGRAALAEVAERWPAISPATRSSTTFQRATARLRRA